jgi:acyl-CoA synthetase (NDP forming)
VVTFGGGNGVLAADQSARFGLTTPALSAGCVERLRPLLTRAAFTIPRASSASSMAAAWYRATSPAETSGSAPLMTRES